MKTAENWSKEHELCDGSPVALFSISTIKAIQSDARADLEQRVKELEYKLNGVRPVSPPTNSQTPYSNWYITPTGAGAKNGTDWNNAWSANAINSACIESGDHIWTETIAA